MNRLSFVAVAIGLASCVPMLAQEAPGVPVSVVVTAEARHGNTVPELTQSNLRVREAGKDRPVESLARIPPDAPVQMMLLIDNSAGSNFDVQIQSMKEWVNSLPPTVQVGVAFMQNGLAQVTSPITADHAAAANSIRIAEGFGGADVDPYGSLSEAIKKWPKTSTGVRREVVMVTSGIEALGGGFAPNNPYVDRTISDAERAGVIVYGIFNPSAGHFGHTFWRSTEGQNLLSQLCDATGGEAYMTTISAPVSFDPFLQDIRLRLGNQYRLSFMAAPENKAGLQPLKVSTRDDNAEAVAPNEVYVKASK